MMYWAMRTSRDTQQYRRFVTDELANGRLRQGWGYDPTQDLRCIQDARHRNEQLTPMQTEANRHWRMADGPPNDYMNVDDIVLVPNMPLDGLFTLCRITGGYDFRIPSEIDDFGHFRPVDVLTPLGVANEHELVDAGLRRSLRYQGRLWRITPYADCVEAILGSNLPPDDLRQGVTAAGRTDSLVAELVAEPINVMADLIAGKLRQRLQSAEWETGILSALEPLFPATVRHTGGPNEQGADLEVVISNPFDDRNDWIVPIQVKDHQGIEGSDVLSQLEQAFSTRLASGRGSVIAVVLLVTDAEPSTELQQQMSRLSGKHRVPFIFCGGSDLMRILARGFLKRV